MEIRASLAKAKDEVKKSIKLRTLSPNLFLSFIQIIMAVFFTVKGYFFIVYDYIYTKLNKLLPLPNLF